MIDLCLKFADEAEANFVLFTQPETDGDQPVRVFHNTDIIGKIFKATGTFDENNQPILEEAPGWHVNVLVNDDEDYSALVPFIVEPVNRKRVWAS